MSVVHPERSDVYLVFPLKTEASRAAAAAAAAAPAPGQQGTPSHNPGGLDCCLDSMPGSLNAFRLHNWAKGTMPREIMITQLVVWFVLFEKCDEKWEEAVSNNVNARTIKSRLLLGSASL